MEHLNPSYLLGISPINEEYATLTNVKGLSKKKMSILDRRIYAGGYQNTTDTLEIECGLFEGRLYKIQRIEQSALSYCEDLKTLVIGKDVLSIEWNMYHLSSLENIHVDNENTIYKSRDGVLYKENILVAYPQGRAGSFTIPQGIKKIGNHAFKSSKISEIVLPNTLEEIGINAFYECKNLKEIMLPPNIKKVYFNNNVDNKHIRQKFYLSKDTHRRNPLTIDEVCDIFN